MKQNDWTSKRQPWEEEGGRESVKAGGRLQHIGISCIAFAITSSGRGKRCFSCFSCHAYFCSTLSICSCCLSPLSSLLTYDPATILAIRTALSPLNKISQISRNFLDCGLTFSAHTCGCMSVGVPACMQVCVCLCACMRVCVFVCLSLLSLASSNYFLQFSSIAQVQFKIISQRFGCLAPSPFLSLSLSLSTPFLAANLHSPNELINTALSMQLNVFLWHTKYKKETLKCTCNARITYTPHVTNKHI